MDGMYNGPDAMKEIGQELFRNRIAWLWVAADRCERKALEKQHPWLQEFVKQKAGNGYLALKGDEDFRGADPCPD